MTLKQGFNIDFAELFKKHIYGKSYMTSVFFFEFVQSLNISAESKNNVILEEDRNSLFKTQFGCESEHCITL